MSDRTCPNCAQTITDRTSTCTCGFSWDDGVEVPSPEIVRSASRRPSAVERLASEGRDERARPATPAVRQELTVLEDDLDLPPLPWETSAEPAPTSTSPETRAEPRTSGNAETAMPRVTDSPPDVSTETAGVIPPTAARYQRSAPSPSSQAATGAGRTDATGTAARQPRAALLMDCPACGVRISKRAETCPKCTTAPWDHCQICATRILVNSATCPECGDPDPFDSSAG